MSTLVEPKPKELSHVKKLLGGILAICVSILVCSIMIMSLTIRIVNTLEERQIDKTCLTQ